MSFIVRLFFFLLFFDGIEKKFKFRILFYIVVVILRIDFSWDSNFFHLDRKSVQFVLMRLEQISFMNYSKKNLSFPTSGRNYYPN